MVGEVSEVTRPAGTWVPRIIEGGSNVASSSSALPGRTVETAPPQGPRNPIVRALASFGRLLARLCCGVRPDAPRNLSPRERATRDTKTHLSDLVRHLTPPSTRSAGQLTNDLRGLAVAHALLAMTYDTDGFANADQALHDAVQDLLDDQWPGDSALQLVEALRSANIVTAQGRVQPGSSAERLLVRIEAQVANVVMQRATATIDRELASTLERIREEALPTDIEAQAQQAFATATAVIGQVRPQLLLSARRGSEAGRERAIVEQTAQMLQLRVAATGASEAELATLMRHLEPETLQLLSARKPANDAVATAVAAEINDRIPRLLGELEYEIRGDERTGGRNRSNTILSSSINNEVQHAALLYQNIIKHNGTFGVNLDQTKLRQLMQELEQQMTGGLTNAHIRATGRGNELADAAKIAERVFGPEVAKELKGHWAAYVERKRTEALAQVSAAIDTLATREHDDKQTSRYLLACKAMVTSVREYLLALGAPPADIADPGRLEKELRTLIRSLPEQQQQAAPAMVKALRSAELSSLVQVLHESSKQARRRALPELATELHDTASVMETIAQTLDPAGRGISMSRRRSSTPDISVVQESTRDTLEQHFSTRIHSDGDNHVSLTAGHVSDAFAAKAKEAIEQPFSEGESSTIMLAGHRVPKQFWADAERSSTVYLGPDGEPLINRTGWGQLTQPDKEARVAAGYRKLLALYEGNERQTETILLLANQGIVAGLAQAARYANDGSPLNLGGAPGVVNRSAMITDELTTVRFSTGANHKPQLAVSYEIRGGRFDELDEKGFETGERVYLDRNRSRAKFSVSVEADAAKGQLHVLGTPTYDVHLVPNPISQPFMMPKVAGEFFQSGSKPLYDVAIPFADRSPAEGNALRASLAIVGWRDEPKLYRARKVYAQHLGPEAKFPLPPEAPNVKRAREGFEQVEGQMLRMFDATEAAIDERMRQNPSSHEAQTLGELLASIHQFKANPDRTLEDAEAILAAFPLSHAAASSSTQVRLPQEVVDVTYAAFNRANQLMNGEMRDALLSLLGNDLKDAVTQLLPDFQQMLMDEAELANTSVNV